MSVAKVVARGCRCSCDRGFKLFRAHVVASILIGPPPPPLLLLTTTTSLVARCKADVSKEEEEGATVDAARVAVLRPTSRLAGS